MLLMAAVRIQIRRLARYNFCRINRGLRVTPAMESKVADHVWTIAELLL